MITETIGALLGAAVTYHGSLTDHHGAGMVDEVCGSGNADEPCDQAIRFGGHDDLRWVLRMDSGAELVHVRRASFTVVDGANS